MAKNLAHDVGTTKRTRFEHDSAEPGHRARPDNRLRRVDARRSAAAPMRVDDPMALRYEQAARWQKILRAGRGERVEDEQVKTVTLSSDEARGWTHAAHGSQGADASALHSAGDKPEAQAPERTRKLLGAVAEASLSPQRAGHDAARAANAGIENAAKARERAQTQHYGPEAGRGR